MAVLAANQPDGTQEAFTGIMDEVWFSHATQPSEWIYLIYENQMAGSAFAVLWKEH